MPKPASLRTKAFREYRKWLMKKLEEEIELRAGYVRDEGWLGAAVHSVAKTDPDITDNPEITDDMVQEAMRTVLRRHGKVLRSSNMSKALCASFRKTNRRIERSLQEPGLLEVMASPKGPTETHHPRAKPEGWKSGQANTP
jgi:hypothetical protein